MESKGLPMETYTRVITHKANLMEKVDTNGRKEDITREIL